MSCCLNPDCQKPHNQQNSKFCQYCGSPIPAMLLDRFRVLKVIAQGGFGRTYLAIDTQKLDEQCVLKQLIYPSRETSLMSRAESMFYEEAKQLQTLGAHPQIPALYAFFIQDGHQYLVQEWIEGNTLKQELETGPLSEIQIRQLLSDVLPVLSFIHRQNVIHRDIKPDNMMRHQKTGKLMLIDFGISKNFCLETLTKTGTIVGSHGYSSREQIMEGKTSPATDLFSLGVSCFQLMTQVSPLELSVNYGFSWIEQWRSHLPQALTPEFEALITKLLAVNVCDRYHCAEDVLHDLTQLPEAPTETPLVSPQPQAQPHIQPQSPVDITVPMNPDPFVTLEPDSSSSASPASGLYETRGKMTVQRRKILKYLGYGVLGGAVSIAVGRHLHSTRSTSQDRVPPVELKGRTTAVGQFETIEILRSGETQTPSPITLEIIREDLGNGVYLDLATIPAGTFLMGSPTAEPWRDEDEGPRHSVTVQSFLMGIYEVTQLQWEAVAQLPKVDTEMRREDSTFQGDNRPVERVTWYEAQEFCNRLSRATGHPYRLPTEAEWEYACRAGSDREFAYGRTITATLANYDASSTYASEAPGEFRKRTTDVGEFYANAWGLHDMHGNVLEWCADHWHDSYENAPNDGSAWIQQGKDQYRVLRGGSWFDPPRIIRSANRSKKRPQVRQGDVGLRVVCELLF